jgi:hypothetical protein
MAQPPKNNRSQKQKRKKLHAGVIDHFERHYESAHSKLEGLQQLCRDVGVEEGSSLTACKMAGHCVRTELGS